GTFLLVCSNLFGQQTTFHRVYHLPNDNYGACIREMSDSSYIIGGRLFMLPFQQTFVWHLDSNGDTLKTFQTCGGGVEALEVNYQNNLIISGASTACNGPAGDVFLTGIDTQGTVLFSNTFGNNGIDRGRDILINNDSTFVIACYNGSYPDLLKVDIAGNIIWSRSYGLSGLYSVKHSLDGGYFVCGNAGGGFVDPMYVAKLDSMGFVIWYKTFYNNNMFIFTDIEPTPDGGVVALCDNWNLYKISSTGDSLWKKNVYPAYSRITTTSDGNLIMTGAGTGMAIVKSDTSGNIIWGRQFSYYPFIQGIGYESNDVIQTSDGGYMLCGLIDSFGVQNLYVVKTDSLGLVTTGLFEVENQLLKSYCYPNPMKQTTQITFSDINLPVLKNNILRLYDSRGAMLKEEYVHSWPYTLHRNNTPPGFYFYTITSQKEVISTGKLVME
ncbi:MAG: T9SS type A sorting domain-containing protein, partial [Bacteroidia bacterium]